MAGIGGAGSVDNTHRLHFGYLHLYVGDSEIMNLDVRRSVLSAESMGQLSIPQLGEPPVTKVEMSVRTCALRVSTGEWRVPSCAKSEEDPVCR